MRSSGPQKPERKMKLGRKKGEWIRTGRREHKQNDAQPQAIVGLLRNLKRKGRKKGTS